MGSWDEFARAFDPRYIKSYTKSNIVFKYKAWIIVMDWYRMSNHMGSGDTRVRIHYRDKEHFIYFKIRPKILFESLFVFTSRFLRNHHMLDKHFVLVTSDADRISRMLDDPALQQRLHFRPQLRIETRKNDGFTGIITDSDTHELSLRLPSITTNAVDLENLFWLSAHLLDQMAETGMIRHDAPAHYPLPFEFR